tara:strand:+ start:656 stop:808 length:153 start_codon:yes stop_codon:yes gene_type:complete
MTRKHFVEIAKIVSNQPETAREALALDFVRMFQADNPRFDPSRFLKACGV